MKTTLLQPAGITEVEVFPTLASGRTNHQAIAEDEGLGKRPLDLASHLLVPAVYGGDGEINEVGDPNDGTGRLGPRADAVHPPARRLGQRSARRGLARSGSTPGASTLAVSRGDGVDWACVVNTRDWPPSTSPTLDDLFDTSPPISPLSITHVLDTTPIP